MASPNFIGQCGQFIRPSAQDDLWEETEEAVDVRKMLGISGPLPDAVMMRRVLNEIVGLDEEDEESDEINNYLKDFIEKPFPFVSWRWPEPIPESGIRPDHVWSCLAWSHHPSGSITGRLADGTMVSERVEKVIQNMSRQKNFQFSIDVCLIKPIYESVRFNITNFNLDVDTDLGPRCDAICEAGARPDAFDHAIFFFMVEVSRTYPQIGLVMEACLLSQHIRRAVEADPHVRKMVETQIQDCSRQIIANFEKRRLEKEAHDRNPDNAISHMWTMFIWVLLVAILVSRYILKHPG